MAGANQDHLDGIGRFVRLKEDIEPWGTQFVQKPNFFLVLKSQIVLFDRFVIVTMAGEMDDFWSKEKDLVQRIYTRRLYS